ncbi:probable tubulin polyglutamylase TTLL2 [Planococcus citri]|uniref:probable tubulin polyglutamylase TTLL2 n=1 Tax=Planococcus citri TaxID=170843 RepID=UPI0031F74166
MEDLDKSNFIFRINDNGIGPNLLHQVCLERGWQAYGDLGSGREWNLWWRTKGFPVFHCHRLDKEQFTNHIPYASFICRKDNLIRCLKCMKKIYGSSFNFIPEGFNLPLEYKKLLAFCKTEEKFNSSGSKEIWICKPVGLSQGRGISLFQNPSDLVYNSNAVVQKYVKNPLLIGGYKFDLRLYVLVPSFHPLTVYIYREGLARFGTEKFSLNNLKNRFAHLTNSSLNKLGPGYLETKERIGAGCKWSLQQLRCYLQQTIGSDWLLWQNISTMIVLTIVSQLSKVPNTVNCFEFYGFDILIDSELKPWLIEVNLSPALSIDCSLDPDIKKPMIHDMFDLIGLPMCNTGLALLTANPNPINRASKLSRKSSETLIKAAIKWKQQRSRIRNAKRTHFVKSTIEFVDNREYDEKSRWGNGRNWNHPKGSDGNWVRVYPSLLSNNNKIKFVKLNNHNHRTYSTDEIKSVVSSIVSYSKIAKEIFLLNPEAKDDQLNTLMMPYLRPDSKIWLPPV